MIDEKFIGWALGVQTTTEKHLSGQHNQDAHGQRGGGFEWGKNRFGRDGVTAGEFEGDLAVFRGGDMRSIVYRNGTKLASRDFKKGQEDAAKKFIEDTLTQHGAPGSKPAAPPPTAPAPPKKPTPAPASSKPAPAPAQPAATPPASQPGAWTQTAGGSEMVGNGVKARVIPSAGGAYRSTLYDTKTNRQVESERFSDRASAERFGEYYAKTGKVLPREVASSKFAPARFRPKSNPHDGPWEHSKGGDEFEVVPQPNGKFMVSTPGPNDTPFVAFYNTRSEAFRVVDNAYREFITDRDG